MLPVANRISDRTPRARLTPETYLGYERLARFSQDTVTPDRYADYRFPDRELQDSELSYDGRWLVRGEEIVAGLDSRLRLRFTARKVHLVLGGKGNVRVLLDGKLERVVRVQGSRLYTLLSLPEVRKGLLELRRPRRAGLRVHLRLARGFRRLRSRRRFRARARAGTGELGGERVT